MTEISGLDSCVDDGGIKQGIYYRINPYWRIRDVY